MSAPEAPSASSKDTNPVVLIKQLRQSYAPTLPDALVTRALQIEGVDWPEDQEHEDRTGKVGLTRLIGIMAQDFVREICNDALAKPRQRAIYLNPDGAEGVNKAALPKSQRVVKRELEDAGFDERAAKQQGPRRKKKGDEDKAQIILRQEDLLRCLEDRGIMARRPDIISDDNPNS